MLGDSIFNVVVVYFLFDYITIKTKISGINYLVICMIRVHLRKYVKLS